MRSDADRERAPAQEPPNPHDFPAGTGTRAYRVVLDDVSSGIETVDSFAIKFSLLTKSPLARMKHIARRLPATVWEGPGRPRAERVLSLIEEAGGKGRIVETGIAPSDAPERRESSPKSVTAPSVAPACAMCGFPMKAGETRCGFCMTKAGGAERVDPLPVSEPPARKFSRTRLLFFGACFVAGVTLIKLFLR